jgi:hypothetical protein
MPETAASTHTNSDRRNHAIDYWTSRTRFRPILNPQSQITNQKKEPRFSPGLFD